MRNRNKVLTILFFLFLIPCSLAFSESTKAEPYDTEEFPQTLKDLRRFEVITLGSMPFVTLDVTLAYSGYKSLTTHANFNPFGASSYTQEEQFNIIKTSLAISAAIGLSDYLTHVIKRNINKKKHSDNESSYINVIPIAEDPDAIKVSLDEEPELESIQEEQSEGEF